MTANTDRSFSCRIDHAWEGWEVWLREDQYRGVRTDAVCNGLGERVRIGGTWSSDWLVGKRRFRRRALRLAHKVVRKAERQAAREDRSDARWQQRRQRGDFDTLTVRSRNRQNGESE